MPLSTLGYSAAVGLAFGLMTASFAQGQGVPVIDSNRIRQEIAIQKQRDTDLVTQGDKKSRRAEILALDDELIADLQDIIDSATVPPGSTQQMVDDLESGSGDSAAAADNLYNPEDTNPAADKAFGDASVTVEEVIIRGAKATYSLPGVAAAGLSLPQWRALLQAMIWQESRFNPFIGSHVGAWGLTQLMPGTAEEVGVAGDYRTNPYSQVIGGAKYLAKMLKRQSGDIVTALAAYNAGPGNVDKYGGVPPFKETQHYVKIIPEKYNEYLSGIGGIDALGTIDPTLASGANFSIAANGTLNYASYSADIAVIAKRVKSQVEKIRTTENPAQAWVLNTYVRAEMARILALQTRVMSVRNKMVSADALQQAAEMASERQYIHFSNE